MRRLRWIGVLPLAGLACNLMAQPAETLAPPPATPTAAAVLPTSTEPSLVEANFVVARDGQFHFYDSSGEISEPWPAPGLEYPGEGTLQAAAGAVYYLVQGEGVYRVTADGRTLLSFTDAPGVDAFAVSPDGGRIAWSSSQFQEAGPEGQLWAAAIDGSAMAEIAHTSPDDALAEFFLPRPVVWTSDGALIYSWQITGIGGYILFYAYSSFYLHAPDGTNSALTDLAQGVCWSSLSPDLGYVVGDCPKVQGDELHMREVERATGGDVFFPSLPDQGVQGAARYSPSGDRLAYLVARGNPDDEFGQVAYRAQRGSEVVSLASTPGYFYRMEWVDETWMLVSSTSLAAEAGAPGAFDLLSIDGQRNPLSTGEWAMVLR